MGAAGRQLSSRTGSRLGPQHVLVLGALAVGWSAARALAERQAATVNEAAMPVPLQPKEQPAPLTQRGRGVRRSVLLASGATLVIVLLAGTAFSSGAEQARAPLLDPLVIAKQLVSAEKQAESARLARLRQLQVAGIAGRRVGVPEQRAPAAKRRPAVVSSTISLPRPTTGAAALDKVVVSLGPTSIMDVLDSAKSRLEQEILDDPRVQIYPGGRGDVASGRVDVRVLALIEYLAELNGSLSVSCLITGHSLYVRDRPGVVSAHIYGRAVDISAVAGIPIVGHQGPGSITERTIRQIMDLPPDLAAKQVISLMTLGGPSFALPDHANHIHVGY